MELDRLLKAKAEACLRACVHVCSIEKETKNLEGAKKGIQIGTLRSSAHAFVSVQTLSSLLGAMDPGSSSCCCLSASAVALAELPAGDRRARSSDEANPLAAVSRGE